MTVPPRCRTLLLVLLLLPPSHLAPQGSDGQRDFDFEIGTWRTHLSVLVSPLSAPPEWAEYSGTSVVTRVWGGDANLVELDATGPRGRIVALSLRLYDPQARQWSLNFANARGGAMATPSIGGFVEGRGEFHSHELVDGRVRWVRFEITPITADSIHFRQSVSSDGGRSWTLNWIAVDSRVRD